MRWIHAFGFGSALVLALAIPSMAAGPFTPVNLRGGGTETLATGACSGDVCTASSMHCDCITVTGTATGTGFGKMSFSLQLTEDVDDTATLGSNGTECFPVQGDLTLTSKPGNTTLGTNGFLCEYAGVLKVQTENATLSYAQVPALGETGKFATAFGTGSVSLMINDQCTMTGCPSALYLDGTTQLKP